MTAGNFTVFYPKQVTAIRFGSTPWSESDLTSTTVNLLASFNTNNTTILADFVGALDTNNPVASAAFARNFSVDGNEIGTTEQNLLGSDAAGAQNQEISLDPGSKIEVTFSLYYRNTTPVSIFNTNTKCCIMTFDNSESDGTGVLTVAFNNIIVTRAGGLTMNEEGLMEQEVKFVCSGGTAGSPIAVTVASPASTYQRVRLGSNHAEEIRLT